MGDINPIKHYCLGNHEMRLYRYENEHKEVVGAFSQQYETLWRKRGWGISEYGDENFLQNKERNIARSQLVIISHFFTRLNNGFFPVAMRENTLQNCNEGLTQE